MFPIIEVFGKEFSTYSLLAIIGVLTAGFFVCQIAKKRGFDNNNFIVVMLISAIGLLIGGHILYGITNIDSFIKLISHWGELIHNFGDFINAVSIIFGGSVFYGGLLGGMVAGMIYCKIKKYNLADYSDIIAPAVPLFHFFGRIGCFLGGCCFGIESPFGFMTNDNHLIPLINGVTRFPVQLLEAVLNLALFFVLWFLLNKNMCKGKIFAIYLCSYSIIRFADEFLRGDTYRGFIFGLSTSQFISIFIFIGSIIYIIVSSAKNKKKTLATKS